MNMKRERGDRGILVIGAGAAGLMTAALLARREIPCTVLERASLVGSSWRNRYDSLSLNTSRLLSRMAGFAPPRGRGHWPSRDEFVVYLERYARMRVPDILLETTADRIEREDGAWCVKSSRGPMRARIVVVATGREHEPFLPPWPGRDSFAGELTHSSTYQNAEPYTQRDVLVVGVGDSAADIVLDLVDAGASRVRMSVRTPPFIILARGAPFPPDLLAVVTQSIPPRIGDRLEAAMRRITVGDLARYGMPSPTEGFFTSYRREPVAPLIDRRGFVRALKARAFEIVSAVEGFRDGEVELTDGSRIAPDAVIAATGYRCGLEPLVGHLGVLKQNGLPTDNAPRHPPGTPGLYFLGYTFPFGGNIREMRIAAKRLARAIP